MPDGHWCRAHDPLRGRMQHGKAGMGLVTVQGMLQKDNYDA